MIGEARAELREMGCHILHVACIEAGLQPNGCGRTSRGHGQKCKTQRRRVDTCDCRTSDMPRKYLFERTTLLATNAHSHDAPAAVQTEKAETTACGNTNGGAGVTELRYSG